VRRLDGVERTSPAGVEEVCRDVADACLGRNAGDLLATTAGRNVVLGHRLGLYHALADGPLTIAELTACTATHAHPVRDWLHGQAAHGYITATDDGRFILFPEQACCLADPHAATCLPGVSPITCAARRARLPIDDDRSDIGTGPRWPDHDEDILLGCDAFFRPGYLPDVATQWIPALGDVAQRLQAGGRIADVGCRLGTSSIIVALAYPAAQVNASDCHAPCVKLARARAANAAVTDRVAFEVASATTFTGTGFDWSPASPACTRPTRWPRPATSAPPQHRTDAGCWSNRPPPTTPRPAATRSGECGRSTANRHPRGRGNRPRGRHPLRAGGPDTAERRLRNRRLNRHPRAEGELPRRLPDTSRKDQAEAVSRCLRCSARCRGWVQERGVEPGGKRSGQPARSEEAGRGRW